MQSVAVKKRKAAKARQWDADLANEGSVAKTSKNGKASKKVSKACKSKKTETPAPESSLATPASASGKRSKRARVTLATAGPPNDRVQTELLKLMWFYADVDYWVTGLDYHEQVYNHVRLNIYWTRVEVGVTIKNYKGTGKPKDVAHFSSPTCTIITHLYIARLVACD